jgi:hypothetical protein
VCRRLNLQKELRKAGFRAFAGALNAVPRHAQLPAHAASHELKSNRDRSFDECEHERSLGGDRPPVVGVVVSQISAIPAT